MKYIVMTAAAYMPAKCRGHYKRVGVVELTPEAAAAGVVPAMLSKRARGVASIVQTWERQSVGLTRRCAYRRALAEAEALAAELNKGGA